MSNHDAVIVGSGPNGLAAAITLARAGRSVTVLEANATIGGAARSDELTEPGFVHDLGSAIHSMVKASPFFSEILSDLERHGLEWVMPPAGVAHPLDDGRAAIAWNDLDKTVEDLGEDGAAYRSYYEQWIHSIDEVADLALNPLLRVPPNPFLAARFGALAALPAATTARRTWQSDEAQALFAGQAAHAIVPLTSPFTSSFGLLLGALVHAHGWGFPRGGAQSLTNAMAAFFTELGGTISTGHRVSALSDIPRSKATIFALTPRQVENIAGEHFPDRYRMSLRNFVYGPGAWKVDYALDEPIPWTNPDVASAGTVHVGGTLDEITTAEASVATGKHADRPFALLAQNSLFDDRRAPAGKHTAWAYVHVPNGSTADRTDALERQIERFAPGFRDIVRTRKTTSTAQLEARNANLVGGDVGGGSYRGMQLFMRPRPQRNPFTTPDDSIFIGSAGTTPGAGVHGMGGYGAARRALRTALR